MENLNQLLANQFIPVDEMDNLGSIFKQERDIVCCVIDAFNFGVIRGKQMERSRRNRRLEVGA